MATSSDTRKGAETPLLQTLEQVIMAHWNQRAAARRLHVHINTLHYRIERIEKLTGFSLSDPEIRVALAVAVRARSLLEDSGQTGPGSTG